MTNSNNDERYRWARQAGLLATIPFLLAIPPIAGVVIGRWIDGRAGTGPWFTVIFVIFGFAAGVREVAMVMKKANQDANDGEKKKDKPRK